MKTICFFSGDITRGGGTERVASMIANGLSVQGGYHILFVSLTEESEPFYPLEKKIRHYALGDQWMKPGFGYVKIIPKLRGFLRKHKIDVIIDIDVVLDILSIPAAKGTKTKVISWEHFNFYYEMRTLYRKLILRYSVTKSDFVVTLTRGDMECYQKYLKRRKRICCIYNPIEPIQTREAACREKWILTAGSLIQIKGMDYLANIAVMVLKKHRDWKWLVLGEGDMRRDLEKTIKQYGLEGQLILKGQVPNVEEYLLRAQIFVLTSRSEGLPMCLLEAKAAMLPCVSFHLPTGPSDIIRDGVNGFLIEPFACGKMAQKINLLIEDPQLRKCFSDNTVLDMKKFSKASILNQWRGLIDRLCG